MINVYTSEAKPIKSWCEGIEETALKQAKNLANHPCTFDIVLTQVAISHILIL